MNQIKRYPYVAKLYTYESLFTISDDQDKFIDTYETGVAKLPIFEQIHALETEEEDEIFDSKFVSSDCGHFDAEEIGSSDDTTGSSADSMEQEYSKYYFSDWFPNKSNKKACSHVYWWFNLFMKTRLRIKSPNLFK